MPTADNCPTEEELARIRAWPYAELVADARPCFAFIRSCWWMPEWGWHECDSHDPIFKRIVRRYAISTGGWSGNEDLIGAMQDNWMLWAMTWNESRRGGHHVFLVPWGQ